MCVGVRSCDAMPDVTCPSDVASLGLGSGSSHMEFRAVGADRTAAKCLEAGTLDLTVIVTVSRSIPVQCASLPRYYVGHSLASSRLGDFHQDDNLSLSSWQTAAASNNRRCDAEATLSPAPLLQEAVGKHHQKGFHLQMKIASRPYLLGLFLVLGQNHNVAIHSRFRIQFF